jgi:mono/diheme cytochrome c family protein
MKALLVALLIASVAVCSAGATTPPKTTTTKIVGNVKVGRTIFRQQGCGSCHMLAAAGVVNSSGEGPDLDTSAKTYAQMINQITKGGGDMTPYGKTLTTAQIQDLAAFVYESAHGK